MVGVHSTSIPHASPAILLGLLVSSGLIDPHARSIDAAMLLARRQQARRRLASRVQPAVLQGIGLRLASPMPRPSWRR
jgi:hypothetical protein